MHVARRLAVVLVAVPALALAGCGGSNNDDVAAPSSSSTSVDDSPGSWPREIAHEAGTTEIPEKPVTIVSTSVTLTGTLLAIDAPVKATAAASVSPLTDDKGFFQQWAGVADQRGVEVLYPNLQLDLEAVEAIEPDLIVGSSLGSDSTMDAYDQLSEIAPTIILDYGANSWQELSNQLGKATGLESNADAVISEFATLVSDTAADLQLPDQPVAVISYNGADGTGVFMPNSSQGTTMTDLGFEYIKVPTELAARARSDASFFTPENASTALAEAKTLFPVPTSGDPTAAITADPLLANQPAVSGDALYLTPPTAFRLDYYSGRQLVQKMDEYFGS
ncbi:MAG: Fe2+-enterobactin ABC transporter substrate-binding protein [Actinomycetales bacterium]|nr:MAG: Fe2+-enterobactin ABC transporter substrate-binding protein [Actinomycetales bacterium]